jgi:Acyl CoA:acetate/3-ketoacid CoA transferase
MKNKIMSVEQAAELVKDGDTVAASSAGIIGYPEYLAQALEKRFLETGSPKNLTVIAGCGHSAHDERGDSRFGHAGMIKRYIASHPMTTPTLQKMIESDEIEGYSLPQGILNQLYRASAAKQPGLISKIGLGTYIDQRQRGGKLNDITKEDIVELIRLDDEDWLFYKSLPVTVALVRATTADENGNLTIEQEALKLEILETALAAKAQGGVVIAQVKAVAKYGTLNAKDVVVPGELVDAVVIADNPEETHRQTKKTVYSPYLSGELKIPIDHVDYPDGPLSAEDIICRRALFELYPGAVVNVGVGIGAGLGRQADIEGLREKIVFTLELGIFGGTPTPMPDFGAAINAEAYIAHPTMFDFYHGGGLDLAFLGTAQVDKGGNVNVSCIAGHPSGQGGFIDISQTSKKVVFVTFFKTKKFEAMIENGQLKIIREGDIPKFVDQVDQITFNGSMAMESDQEIVYITERAVFKLTNEGLVLTETAPGVRLQEDIIDQMGFVPIISPSLKTMDERIFMPGRMGVFDKT